MYDENDDAQRSVQMLGIGLLITGAVVLCVVVAVLWGMW